MLRPSVDDHRVVGLYTGKIVSGVGLLMIVPLVTALVFREWDTAIDFGIGLTVCLAVGLGLQALCRTSDELQRRHGLVVVSASWILATALGAIPLYLSGHMGSYLDAVFDVMSGLTTTGLYLMQDLDHVSNGLNMWRFILTFAGGQGIVVIALTFLFKGVGGGLYHLYSGEGKEDRLLPNVVHTARVIWLISLGWLAVGTTALTIGALALGQAPVRAFLHSLWVFMGAFSTGGFAPQSYNTFWYHSLAFEIMCIIIFVAGSLNFAVHWAVWTGERSELRRNVETRSFAVTLGIFTLIAAIGLARSGVYTDALPLVRKTFYLLISGHTTTGFGTVYSRALVTQWGPLAMLAIIGTMVIGASSCSTAGGIKGIRIAIITKAFVQEARRMLGPDSAVVTSRYHHLKNRVLQDATIRSVLLITVAFLTLHAIVTMAGVLAGYPFIEAAFDGVSAASNTGLSCGVVSPSMPGALKAVYVVAMWLGRMEFLAVFALFGWLWSVVRGR
ncbi:MAG: TrkH family potassium uptake protein [Coriobacteriia bacterium]|nr:TrkH family potassium uptake protein [Coriobacteriia bacterium]MBN2847779.1 TrkH family potassium uptake protein [Coriobacteriia bacterium]